MNHELMIERLFPALISGDRATARALIQEALDDETPAETIAHDVFWPLMEMVSSMYRADQLSTLAHHYASRLLRCLVDQMQASFVQQQRRERSILMFCGPAETEELAAQLVADLAEADGYAVTFGGGGIASDEILEEVNSRQPDILLMFASAPTDAPQIRQLIDTVREIGACDSMQIVVGGGVFNRAEGLAEEIGADVWARTPQELLRKLIEQKDRRATDDQRTVGRVRRTASAPGSSSLPRARAA